MYESRSHSAPSHSEALSKRELLKELHQKTKIMRPYIKILLTEYNKIIARELARKEIVFIYGVGWLYVKKYKKRKFWDEINKQHIFTAPRNKLKIKFTRWFNARYGEEKLEVMREKKKLGLIKKVSKRIVKEKHFNG